MTEILQNHLLAVLLVDIHFVIMSCLNIDALVHGCSWEHRSLAPHLESDNALPIRCLNCPFLKSIQKNREDKCTNKMHFGVNRNVGPHCRIIPISVCGTDTFQVLCSYKLEFAPFCSRGVGVGAAPSVYPGRGLYLELGGGERDLSPPSDNVMFDNQCYATTPSSSNGNSDQEPCQRRDRDPRQHHHGVSDVVILPQTFLFQ